MTRSASRSFTATWPAVIRRAALALLLAALPLAASAKTILVIAAHEDDESMIAAGRVRAARLAGDVVKVVLATNAESSVTEGLVREGESVAAAGLLGLSEDDVIFMGYGGGSLNDLYRAGSPADIYTSLAGLTATYAQRGLGRTDYHRGRTGAAALYTRDAFVNDLRVLLDEYRPDEIYTTSYFDMHPDHQALSLFLHETIIGMQRSGISFPVKVYQAIVWMPQGIGFVQAWPRVSDSGFTPWLPLAEPECCLDSATQLDWERALHFPVPVEMQSSDPSASLKYRAIQQYRSQLDTWLTSFARKDEVFWLSDYGTNLAPLATVSVSSEDWWPHGALKAVNGVTDGAPHDWLQEWVSGELDGAWIRLDWPAPVTITQVNLFDRPSLQENVLSGTLTFSDGSSVAVGALPPSGKVAPITFAPRTVSWVRFTITAAQGSMSGLSEIEVLGHLAASGANRAPHFLSGPTPAFGAQSGTGPVTLLVEASDVNGDPIQISWTADGGSIQPQGNGTSAVFTPPAVTSETVFTITAQIQDGRGGTTSNSAFVTVQP